jgi:hypothetical protein
MAMDKEEKIFSANVKISRKIMLRVAIDFFDILVPPVK